MSKEMAYMVILILRPTSNALLLYDPWIAQYIVNELEQSEDLVVLGISACLDAYVSLDVECNTC